LTGGITYTYSSTQNDGQITGVTDSLSGEAMTYQYDVLKRLTSASSSPISGSMPAAYTETFGHDGFGNLTSTVLNGTTTSIAVDATTNRLTSASYDANGNMTSGAGATLTYDVANRLVSAAETSGGIEYYGYAPDNKRVYRKLASGTEEVTLYGFGGEKLGTSTITSSYLTMGGTLVWFGGKLISDGTTTPMFQDRLGTNRASAARFYPYGEELTSTANDREKFGTYIRDGYTGLDYADQRFYASTYGRFTKPDPSGDSIERRDPSTWNRYAYTNGDPVNANDPNGLCDVVIGGITQNAVNAADVQSYAEGNNAISVYPYSASSDNSSFLSTLGNRIDGVIQIAAQTFGANSSTYAAVEGLALAAQDGGPINVTTFSGGGAALTSAIQFLNADGGTSITSLINNITYVAPGNGGALYNNGNAAWIGGGFENSVVGIATSIPQQPSPPQVYSDQWGCGHDFGCLSRQFSGVLQQRSGTACSNPTVVNQVNTSRWQRMFVPGYANPFWYDIYPVPSPGKQPSVTEQIWYH
jgi:RHS repeat-associated protein